MIVESGSHSAVSQNVVATRRPLRKRPLLWILVAAAGLVAVFAAIFAASVPLSANTFRDRIVRTLSDKLDSDVELGDLSLRVWPTMRAAGADLRIRRHGASGDTPPLIWIKSFHVDASLAGLMRKHVDHVQLTGLT